MKASQPLLGILAITLALTSPSRAQSFLTNGLVAYYPFNDNANDATGNGNNGQIIGNVVPATDRFGNAAGAFHFDGSTSSAVEVTNFLFNIGQQGYTISGWFASDNFQTNLIQILFNTIPETGMGIGYDPSAKDVDYAVGPANGTWTELATGIGQKSDYVNDTWYQFVFTKSGDSYTTYINGAVDSTNYVAAASSYNASVGGLIGSISPINPSYDQTFLGRLDDFRIYNRALSSNEVQELYTYESAPQGGQPCTPHAATAAATVVNGLVVGAAVTDGGCGYTNVPMVSFTGGGGSGATAIAVVSNGMVVSLTITSPGSGYISAPTVDIVPPSVQATAPALPAVTSGTLQLWLKADAGVVTNASGQVSQWQDQSGNANHAAQASAQNQPLLVYPAGLGGQPVLRFNGIQDRIHGQYLHGQGAVSLPNALTAFAVYNVFTDTNAANFVWLVGVPGTAYGAIRGLAILEQRLDFSTWAYDYQTPGVFPTNTYRICTDRVDTNLSTVQIYDNAAGSETNFSLPINQPIEPLAPGYYIGGIDPSLPYVSPDNWDGDIAEVIIYSGYLSEADRLAVLNYLQQKYSLSSSGEQAPPFADSLVAYFPFNGNANDATGNGNNGTLFGSTAFGADRFGNSNACLSLPGTQGNGSGVDVPSLTSLPFAPATYSAWFWLRNYPPPPTAGPNALMNLVGREQCDDQSDGTVGVYSDPSTGESNNMVYFTGAVGYATYSSPPPNQWCQVVLTIDHTGQANFYMDGTNVSGRGQAPPGQPLDFRIGASAGSPCPYQYVWNGLIDDVRVYNRVLSAQEVQELYAYESVPETPPNPPCAGSPATATAAVVNGFVVGVTVTDGGCGYTNVPVISFIGGGGSGAAANAIVSNGVVVGITVTDAGSGYTNPPAVVFGASIIPSSAIIADVTPVFSGLSVGAAYQLQVSSGADMWADYDSPFVATNSTVTYPQSFSVTNCDQLLFRLVGPPAADPANGQKNAKPRPRLLTKPSRGL